MFTSSSHQEFLPPLLSIQAISNIRDVEKNISYFDRQTRDGVDREFETQSCFCFHI